MTHPADWPKAGAIDLDVHDLPHASSSTEWWYLNGHLRTATGRDLSFFVSFFRVVKGRDEATGDFEHAHSITFALSDPAGQRYWHESRVDKDAPRMGLQKVDRGEGARDQRLRRAIREVLVKGKVPYPDQVFGGEVFVDARKLDLEFDGQRLSKDDAGRYHLHLRQNHAHVGLDVCFAPQKPAVRHGQDGVVKGVSGEDMFYYFLPRCEVTGSVLLPGGPEPVTAGQGWYDHEFGLHQGKTTAEGERQKGQEIGWNWLGLQLHDGRELSAYRMVDEHTGESVGQLAVLVAPDGSRQAWHDFTLDGDATWTSTRTFADYPTRWRIAVPDAAIDVVATAAFDDQEFITVISKPAFWEGRVHAQGRIGGEPVEGLGYLEHSGQNTIADLDGFFSAVGRQVRKSVDKLAPHDPSWEQVRDLVAAPDRPQYMQGVDVPQFTRTMIKPVRAIVDRGGKSWRSYAALACCDIVGGDSRQYVQWLAMPELMHVGSLIVDDVQDKSTIRRGGPTAHLVYGEALAINAGTACYFMGQKLLTGRQMSAANKLRLYDLYFESLRAGHAGQALDLDGVDAEMPRAVEHGGGTWLEDRVLAVHRLKTAVPAASLARMGAVVGGGSEAQIEGIGRFFESVGLAFQIVDDVLNLRGFKGDLKSRGEDIAHGKVTLPVAKGMARLDRGDRAWLWDCVRQKSDDRTQIEAVIAKLEACGAIETCAVEARVLVESAWRALDPLVEDSLPKVMLRAFGWYVLERHY
ncbi:MAG: polyprenyl synthetase family protein [Deltaproteobacteria bacterium]|nr:polyprenyl synthetase family protein [Deltaproteobacteria bacterium]